jgi:hypothetical protein
MTPHLSLGVGDQATDSKKNTGQQRTLGNRTLLNAASQTLGSKEHCLGEHCWNVKAEEKKLLWLTRIQVAVY